MSRRVSRIVAFPISQNSKQVGSVIDNFTAVMHIRYFDVTSPYNAPVERPYAIYFN